MLVLFKKEGHSPQVFDTSCTVVSIMEVVVSDKAPYLTVDLAAPFATYTTAVNFYGWTAKEFVENVENEKRRQ